MQSEEEIDAALAALAPNQIANLPSLTELVGRNWVTLHQFKELVGVTYQTALRYVKTKKIRAIKIGGSWRVYEEELRRFLSEGNGKGDGDIADNDDGDV